MRWEKLGHVFAPTGEVEWMRSHAANPFAVPQGNGAIRVFFNTRDDAKRAFIASLEMRIAPTPTVLSVRDTPLLEPGNVGFFDDSGVSLGCIVVTVGKIYLYYVGWNLSVTVPWRNSIGLAVSDAHENRFLKAGRAPILDRNEEDPFSLSYPAVIKDGNLWRMYYGSNLSWGGEHESMEHVIKYATSLDGKQWRRDGLIAIDLAGDGEYALARPSVLKDQNGYHMWYSYRGSSYRIGYAWSSDGVSWERRDDDAGISASDAGWDSEMMCYPHVFDANGQRYMLYNGNGYGRTGFGLAQLVQ